MLTSIDVKLPSSFACFSASLADILQIADVIRRVVFFCSFNAVNQYLGYFLILFLTFEMLGHFIFPS